MPSKVSKNIAKILNVIFHGMALVSHICVCVLYILLTLIQKSHLRGRVSLANHCD